MTDQELQQQVAKIAGYRVVYQDGRWFVLDPTQTREQLVRALIRDPLRLKTNLTKEYVTEEEAWKSERIPDYLHDLNACYILLESFVHGKWNMIGGPLFYYCYIYNEYDEAVVGQSGNLCEAVCLAVAQYSNEEREP